MLNSSSLSPSPSSSSTLASLSLHDVLVPGDIVGEGSFLKGHVLRLVANNHHATDQQPAVEFQVIKELGKGSYAVVYLVQEILSKPDNYSNDHISTIGLMDLDVPNSTCYGRKFAIKCLSKANLDQDALALQMSEVTIHQSLPLHPNIVTLHRTLETPAYLLLLLEYVPGEDLFYFLEQSRDHDDLNHYLDDNDDPTTLSSSHTPPTPSLLSTLHPSQLLSKTRLRLIASMFSQMCDAVATCHANQVFHRDIKPENFIVTDGFLTAPDGSLERKVVVKLTDFGLSTKDVESSDMDCGSAPYMSYECRNNVAPTYSPRAADVWSLGIVLINMLYHSNPWTDTAQDSCPSFQAFRQDPVSFFVNRFSGMTQPVADLLATRIFCVLDNPLDDSPRMSASEFGVWVRNWLPVLLSGVPPPEQQKRMSTNGHRLSLTMPVSHRPTSRPPSVYSAVNRAPSLSRAPSLKLEPTLEREELSIILDKEEEAELDNNKQEDVESSSRSASTTRRRKRGLRKGKGSASATPSISSCSTSPTTLQNETCLNLAAASQSLAREISRASKTSSAASVLLEPIGVPPTKVGAGTDLRVFEPLSVNALPSSILSMSPPPATTSIGPNRMTKKPSKWRLGFGRNNSAAAATASVSTLDEHTFKAGLGSVDLGSSPSQHTSGQMSATASNVTNLIMSLDPPLPVPSNNTGGGINQNANGFPSFKSRAGSSQRRDVDGLMVAPMGMGMGIGIGTWTKDRRVRMGTVLNNDNSTSCSVSTFASPTRQQTLLNPNRGQNPSPTRPCQVPWSAFQDRRAILPHSPRTGYVHGHGLTGGGSSTSTSLLNSSSSAIFDSTNWRSSMSTMSSMAMSSCTSVDCDGGSNVGVGGRSAYTRSNNSVRSVSTTATHGSSASVGSASWRTGGKNVDSCVLGGLNVAKGGGGGGRRKQAGQCGHESVPKNVKQVMDGGHCQLDQLPRGHHPNPNPIGDIYGSPPVRKQRTRKNKETEKDGGKLDTINERPIGEGGASWSTSVTAGGSCAGGDGEKSQAQAQVAFGVESVARKDASTSTTDLCVGDLEVSGGGNTVKKVQKGQIHALAKMLSALRREK